MTTTAPNRPARLNVRATQHQKDTIAHAAVLTHATISEFILTRAYRDAQEILAEQNDFRLSERQWQAFNKALDNPPKNIPALRRLLKEPGIFDA